jgi:hypothetical protein
MSYVHRSLLLAALVLACAAVPATSSSSVAEFGTYHGHDAHGQTISFEYAYDSVVNFNRGGSYFISQATVVNATFKKTEGNHTVDAHWTSSTEVAGTITFLILRNGQYVSQTIRFSATRGGGTGGLVIPYVGRYSGTDQHGRQITFSFDGTDIRHFAINGTVYLNQGYAAGGSMSTSQNGWNFTARWTSDKRVSGTYSNRSGTATWSASAP